MLIIYEKDGTTESIYVTDEDGEDAEVTIQRMLAANMLPFGEAGPYRTLSEGDIPEHPLENWGATFLQTGTIPDLGPYTPPVFFPPITKRQFRLEMIELEKDDELEDIIAAMPTKDQKKLRAELDANEYHFESPFVSQLAAALGFSDEEKEQFWREAANR